LSFIFRSDFDQIFVRRGFTGRDIIAINPVVDHMPGDIENGLDLIDGIFII
jgi:hypothetical protein